MRTSRKRGGETREKLQATKKSIAGLAAKREGDGPASFPDNPAVALSLGVWK